MKPYRLSSARSAVKPFFALLGLTFTLSLTALPANAPPSPSPAPAPAAPSAPAQALETAPPAEQMQLRDIAVTEPRENRIQNILLVGQDHQEGEPCARSDTIILCTFDPGGNQLTLTSFLRDLYVPIPGHGSNRINAAYAFGGTKLLKQTMEEAFDLEIHGCIEVDFSQFCQIVDLLGGVTIPLRRDEAELINLETYSTLSEGEQLLNGAQALSYARIRRLDKDGDFSRTDRQRRVLGAIWDSCRESGTGTILRLLQKILPMITTDMGTTQILSFATGLLPNLSEIQISSQRIPQAGQYTDQTIDGMAVLVPDLEAARSILRQIQPPTPQSSDQST